MEDTTGALCQLVSTVECSMITMIDDCSIRIMKCSETHGYFINVNRNVEMAADIAKGEDNMMMTIMLTSSNHQDSQLIVRLERGEEHITTTLKGRKFKTNLI